MEISRLRATGLMLRNCAVPLLLTSITSIAEAATRKHVTEAATVAVLSLAGALSAIRQGKRLRIWADMKTLQICYWIANIDELIQGNDQIAKLEATRSPEQSPAGWLPRWRGLSIRAMRRQRP